MCVYVYEGAGRLEQQFGGDPLLVPMAGEFFLRSERLIPVAGGRGSCRCTEYEDRAANRRPGNANPPPATAPVNPPVTATAVVIPPASVRPPSLAAKPVEGVAAPNLAPPPAPAATAAVVEIPRPVALVESSKPAAVTHAAATAPPVPDINGMPIELAVVPPSDVPPNIAPPAKHADELAETNPPPPAAEAYYFSPDANRGAPVAARNDQPQPSVEAPAIAQPGVIVYLPPLAFSSNLPQPPPEMTPALAEQLNESRVSPDWVFKGHVESAVARAAKGQKSATQGAATSAGLATPASGAAGRSGTQRKPHGVWRRLRRFFGGHPAPPPEPSSGSGGSQ
jgi:hypothetical protein